MRKIICGTVGFILLLIAGNIALGLAFKIEYKRVQDLKREVTANEKKIVDLNALCLSSWQYTADVDNIQKSTEKQMEILEKNAKKENVNDWLTCAIPADIAGMFCHDSTTDIEQSIVKE